MAAEGDGTREETCENCRYFNGKPYKKEGRCRRRPPAMFHGNGQFYSSWPSVKTHDWCGEFSPTDEAGSRVGDDGR